MVPAQVQAAECVGIKLMDPVEEFVGAPERADRIIGRLDQHRFQVLHSGRRIRPLDRDIAEAGVVESVLEASAPGSRPGREAMRTAQAL